ncbi:MAG TPA: hypothetical protein H9770_00130, partial [Candidatus Fournierella excrementigallinarum]|nr:hypothetical protein [Candidatus Fournierella excrementigallinarum]
ELLLGIFKVFSTLKKGPSSSSYCSIFKVLCAPRFREAACLLYRAKRCLSTPFCDIFPGGRLGRAAAAACLLGAQVSIIRASNPKVNPLFTAFGKICTDLPKPGGLPFCCR